MDVQTENLPRSALDRLVKCYVRQYGGSLDRRQTFVEICTVISTAGAESLNYVPSVVCFSVSGKVRELEISTTIDGLIDRKAAISILISNATNI